MIAYLTAIATLVGVRALVTLGLNVQWGMAGLVNLGAVAFFAVGAYTSALLAVGGTPLLFAWPAAVGLAAAAGAGLAMVALRLREDYLAIVTLGFGEVLRLFLLNEAWLTRGANGVTAIPRPLHAQFTGHYDVFYLVLVLATVAVVYLALERVRRSPFGRLLRAIRKVAWTEATAALEHANPPAPLGQATSGHSSAEAGAHHDRVVDALHGTHLTMQRRIGQARLSEVAELSFSR